MNKSDNGIGLFSLVGIIISAIIGAGIFNLMKEMANTASVGVTMIGWLIAGIGMGALAMCMENLNNKRPDLDAGIFSYAQAGFGDYMGFNSVWGYWISVIIGNVAFGTLMFSALSYFFPIFGDGQNVASIIGASIMLWLIHFMILRGLNSATLLNTVVMVAKLVPIVIFLICIVIAFNKDIFLHDFWGTVSQNFEFGEVFSQLKGTMLVTVWVFIGIEGAVIFSGRAKKRSDVGKATILGFVAVTAIYTFVTVLSYGVLSQQELQRLPNPAMAYVLEHVIGKPGAIIVNLGVIISIFGAWIANTLLAEEIAFQAGKRELFPKVFIKENSAGMPVTSTVITNVIIQILLLSFLVTSEAYSLLSQLSSATILLPYTCVALYQMKLIFQDKSTKFLSKNMIVGLIATIYMLWLVYASGIMYVVLTILTLGPGAILYVYVQRKGGKKVFKSYETGIFILIMGLFCYGLYMLPTFIQ